MTRWRFDGFNDTYIEYWKAHEDIGNGYCVKLVMKYDPEKGKIWPHVAIASDVSERMYNLRGIAVGGQGWIAGIAYGYKAGEMVKVAVRGVFQDSVFPPAGVSGTHTFHVGDTVWFYDQVWPRSYTYSEATQPHAVGIVIGRYGTTGDIGDEIIASSSPPGLDIYFDFRKLLEADDVIRFKTN